MMTGRPDPSQTFLEEAAELLVQLEEALLGLEQAPADRELLDTAFRALHTIKGSGAMFGFEAAASFTHHLEGAFDLMRQGGIAPNADLIGVALEAKDYIRALIETPTAADATIGERLLARVAGLVGPSAKGPSSSPPPETAVAEPAIWRIRFRLAQDAMARGTNPLLLIDELHGLGVSTVVALTDGVPPLAEMDPCDCYLAWDVVLTTEQPQSTIEEVFIFVIDDMELTIERIGTTEAKRLGDILIQRNDIPVEVATAVAARQEKLGTLLVRDGGLSEDKLRSALAEQKHVRAEAETAHAAQQGANSIRVPAERLDNLMDQVGELVIAQARLKLLIARSPDSQIKSVAEDIERLANGLRDTTMGIRMLPIGSLFGRFRRLVRDLSHELRKDIALSTEGEETELDKTVMERLNDPLVHLIRNAIDHGIEPPEERARQGKPAQARVHLSARHAGAEVMITVKDDGRGMDVARIRAKAEDQGLIPPGADIPEGELLQLVFHPGFSTAAAVTSVSGRGVGMDVVKRTIDGLRGTIDMATHPGAGTDVMLRLPLTLAIIDGMLVRVGTGRYVIPLTAVEECVELSPVEAQRSTGRNFLNIRDELVPYLRLRELFSVEAQVEPYQKVVVVSAGDFRVGLVVDQIIGDYQTVIKSLSKLHADIDSFSGATILGDGAVALILDVQNLVGLAQAHEQRLLAS